jgi:nicotinamide-nucleotide amidase
MTAEIISIGDELLIGQVINTNSSWMAREFNQAGIKIHQITAISDDKKHITSTLDEASQRADLILITGGLGPTKDDITKNTLCEYFQSKMVFNPEVFENIRQLFGSRGIQISELNRKQAEIPDSCIPIKNSNGTAPGMWFEKKGKIFISMPGVPFEMQAMVTDFIIPEILKRFQTGAIVHKTILTVGIPESLLAKKIENWEDRLPAHIRLAYLPQPGSVRLRLTATGDSKTDLEQQVKTEIDTLNNIIPGSIISMDDDLLESIVGRLLLERKKTISTAESCTGGYIAHLITTVAGSSEYFKGSVIAYSNEIKESFLGVSQKNLMEFGAVSEHVALEMANGARTKLKTDFAIATTGIAGPGGGTPQKPVGTTWIAIASPGKTYARHFMMGEHRERNIRRTALSALNMLREAIITAH